MIADVNIKLHKSEERLLTLTTNETVGPYLYTYIYTSYFHVMTDKMMVMMDDMGILLNDDDDDDDDGGDDDDNDDDEKR